MLRAIVFDFDGVIADSEPLHFAAFRDILAGAGVVLSEQEYYARFLGFDDVGAFTSMAAAHGQPWSAGRIAELVARKASRFEALERGGALLFPGADAAIRRAAVAVPIAIASGAAALTLTNSLKRSGRFAISSFECCTALELVSNTACVTPHPCIWAHSPPAC